MRSSTSSAAVAVAGSSLALSASASSFVAQHPDQAAIAIAAALEAAATQYRALHPSEREVPEGLKRFLVPPPDLPDELISPEQAAERLAVSRATVYNWIEARRLLAWRLTKQGTLIPAEQILGQSEVVPGIERVLEVMPEPRMAWRFLSEESPFFDSPQRPIDVLKKGEIEQVVQAAQATGEDFT